MASGPSPTDVVNTRFSNRYAPGILTVDRDAPTATSKS